MDTNVKLTSAELANIWGAYQNASITSKVLLYFQHIVEDKEIEAIVQEACSLQESHLQSLMKLFQAENLPIPIGFTNKDVNTDAPRLYTDSFLLQYTVQMGMLGMSSFTQAINSVTRKDIYQFFMEGFQNYNALHQNALSVALAKGIQSKAPTIPEPNKVDFVKKQSFLNGWLGERRPLTALEIANLFSNISHNNLGIATLTGFRQVSKNKQVTDYITRGINIAKKHADIFSTFLKKGDVPAPAGSESLVTDVNSVAPFSDKLMMTHVTAMITIGITFYGISISTNIRRDLAAAYARLSAEIGLYSEDGANILIDNEWLEEPPKMVDRGDLAK
ncbi:DUF3231 family protein [Lentibacillus sp. N15]|uniref:DUF3231 family protein n=1 Tax=Lentibacillus songyuanensis TaxID=3136161 RepID=UPI0031BA6849